MSAPRTPRCSVRDRKGKAIQGDTRHDQERVGRGRRGGDKAGQGAHDDQLFEARVKDLMARGLDQEEAREIAGFEIGGDLLIVGADEVARPYHPTPGIME